MARKRSRKNRKNLIMALFAMALAAAAVYGAWAYWVSKKASGNARTSAASLCDRFERALAQSIASPKRLPQVGATATALDCRWSFHVGASRGKVELFLQDQAALNKESLSARDYYASALTGAEYAYKEAPTPLSGLGEQAASVGFDVNSDLPAQIIVLRANVVLVLATNGLERKIAISLARQAMDLVPADAN